MLPYVFIGLYKITVCRKLLLTPSPSNNKTMCAAAIDSPPFRYSFVFIPYGHCRRNVLNS